jgi:predicted transcriptional regulator
MSTLDPDELKARCATLGLPVNRLAGLAGLNKHTLHKIFNGTCMPRLDTLRAIVAALEAEERRVLAHLLALHGGAVPAILRQAQDEDRGMDQDRGLAMALAAPHLNAVAA